MAKYDAEKFDSTLNTFREIYSNPAVDKYQGTVILPLDFSLEMDGISGIIPNSAFVIPANSLPKGYVTKKGEPKVAFILHTIDHNFGGNKWTTKMTGQTLNIRFDELTEVQKKSIEDFRLPKLKARAKKLGGSGNAGSKGKKCTEPYTTKNLNKGWEGKQVAFVRTVVDPKVEGPKLTKKYGKTLAQAILATIQIEQGYKGFNWNLGGFDITSGGWTFKPELHNGYVVAKEGGTGLCKAFVSFISFETFIEQKAASFTKKGFDKANTADKYAQTWYEKWNGYGARAVRSDEENLKSARSIWNNNSQYV
jgi:hypothetical protein